MSTTNNISYQIHHVIPLEILRIHGTRLAKIFGITPEAFMQSYNNRMGLFTDPDQAKIMQDMHGAGVTDTSMGSSRHLGPHKGYSEAVEERVSNIINDKGTDAQKRHRLIDLQGALRDMLHSGVPPLTGEANTIADYLNKHTASQADLANPESAGYKRMMDRVGNYEVNDRKYPELMEDKVTKDKKGQYSSDNSLFVERTGPEVAKSILDAHQRKPFLSDHSRNLLEGIRDGKNVTNGDVRNAVAKALYDHGVSTGEIARKTPQETSRAINDAKQDVQRANDLSNKANMLERRATNAREVSEMADLDKGVSTKARQELAAKSRELEKAAAAAAEEARAARNRAEINSHIANENARTNHMPSDIPALTIAHQKVRKAEVIARIPPM